jgi:hypothetical protein
MKKEIVYRSSLKVLSTKTVGNQAPAAIFPLNKKNTPEIELKKFSPI